MRWKYMQTTQGHGGAWGMWGGVRVPSPHSQAVSVIRADTAPALPGGPGDSSCITLWRLGVCWDFWAVAPPTYGAGEPPASQAFSQ